MRYSNYIGIVAALCLTAACFMEWVYIGSVHASISGLNTVPTRLGKPGLVHIFFSIVSISFFTLSYTWAKRANLFVTAFNLAWAFRNFLIVTQCQMGECPEKRAGIYTVLLCSLVLLVMSLLPKLPVKNITVNW